MGIRRFSCLFSSHFLVSSDFWRLISRFMWLKEQYPSIRALFAWFAAFLAKLSAFSFPSIFAWLGVHRIKIEVFSRLSLSAIWIISFVMACSGPNSSFWILFIAVCESEKIVKVVKLSFFFSFSAILKASKISKSSALKISFQWPRDILFFNHL